MSLVDRAVRRWAALVLFLLFGAGVGLTFTHGARAQSTLENTMRISALESWRKDRMEKSEERNAQVEATERRLLTAELAIKDHAKQLDDIAGYVRWLVLGVFGLLGIAAWEKLVPRAAARR